MTIETARARLAALADAIETRGPILELDRRWFSPRPGETVEDACRVETDHAARFRQFGI